MKQIVCSLFLFFLLMTNGPVSAETISTYFVTMPAAYLPGVKTDTRKDLIDFYNYSKTAVMPAIFGGKIYLEELTSDYLLLLTSDRADLQLKLLSINDSTQVLAMVQTVAAPLKHSTVSFFTTRWQPLRSVSIPKLSYLDFLDLEKAKALGLTNRLNDLSMRNFMYVKFRPNLSDMVVYSSLKKDLRPEILPDFLPVIKDSVTYKWTQGCFK